MKNQPAIAQTSTAMQVYVTKNQQQLGPFTVDQVRARVVSREFNGSDLGWYEGLANWISLTELLRQFPLQREIVGPPKALVAGLGKASFIISIVGVVGWFILIIVGVATVGSEADEESPMMILLGLCLFGGVLINLAGLGLGIAGLFKSSDPLWTSWVGIALNLIQILGIGILLLIGSQA